MSLQLFNKFGVQTSSGFLPTSISDLTLWLDAADTSTITDSGGAISQWNDKSGNANHASQTTGSYQPLNSGIINNLNAIIFDGFTDHFTVPTLSSFSSQTFTIYCVVNPDPGSSQGKDLINKYYSAGTPYATFSVAWYSNNKWSIATGSTTNGFIDTQSTNTFTQTKTKILAEYTQTSKTLTVNNSVEVNVSTPSTAKEYNTQAFTIGAWLGDLSTNNSFDGLVGEILLYDRILTSTEKTQINSYINNKWAV